MADFAEHKSVPAELTFQSLEKGKERARRSLSSMQGSRSVGRRVQSSRRGCRSAEAAGYEVSPREETCQRCSKNMNALGSSQKAFRGAEKREARSLA